MYTFLLFSKKNLKILLRWSCWIRREFVLNYPESDFQLFCKLAKLIQANFNYPLFAERLFNHYC